MAMLDKIWQGTGNIPSEPTRLLPSNFFAPAMPVSLEIEDIFSIKGSVPTGSEFRPLRSFFLEDINAYLIFDVGDPYMVAIYLIDNETKETLASYTYMADTCPIYKANDRFVDCCVHHDDMSKELRVSFLIVNDVMRTVTIARFALQVDHIREPYDKAGDEAYYIHLTDLLFFANLIAPGAVDEVALPFAWETVASFGSPSTTHRYPKFIVDSLLKRLRDTFHCGKVDHKYCSLTIDEAGHYFVLIGSRITCHLGPHLEFPVDVQYVVLLDQGGMHQRFVLIGPYQNYMCWDEAEEHQPYKFNATVFDGRYILCLEERKSRYIAPRRVFVNGIETEPDGRSYTQSTASWRGGTIADVYYPPQQASTTYPLRLYYVEIGYPSIWDEQSVLEPVSREYVWTLVDICDLLTAEEPHASSPPYAADVVFLVDVSGSMGGNISQVQSNIGTFASTLASLKITDYRIGVAAYTNSQMFMAYQPNNVMWASNPLNTNALASGLRVGIIPTSSAMHNAGLLYLASSYRFRTSRDIPKYVVLVTDTGDEGDTATRAQAISTMADLGIKVCVVSYQHNASFFSSLAAQTGGIFYDISGNWGPRVSSDLALRISEDAGVDNTTTWWDKVVAAWRPRVLYKYTPVMEPDKNSLVTIFHDTVSYVMDGHVVRNKVNYLAVYDDYPVNGGMPQNAIYIPGIVPGEEMNETVIIRNESLTGKMKNIDITLEDVPEDVTITLSDFPEKLEPQEMSVVSLTVSYAPGSSPVARHIDAKYKVTYWMQHVLSCSVSRPSNEVTAPVNTEELYFVSDTSPDTYIGGLDKEIAFAPMFTDTYVTTVSHKTGDAAKAANMVNSNFYVIPKEKLASTNYERATAGPISALAGHNVAETGCAWLKITGPIDWHTQRDHNVDVNTITWWMVNKSSEASFMAHVHMDDQSISNLNTDMGRMGFLLIEYPEGNLIPPGESRPVTFRWRPIFIPTGEQVTLAKTYHNAPGIQTNFPQSAWNTTDAVFNNMIYVYPNIVPNFQFVHIWEEHVAGDGLDMTIPKDYPLKKFDPKLLTPYSVNTELTVDVAAVVTGFPFVEPEQIWGGHREDPEPSESGEPAPETPEEVAWNGYGDPYAHYTYKEYASPAAPIECLPSYVDHRFVENPDYNYNADTEHPFQLTPFNREYATDYVATAFYGNELIKSETVANIRYVDMDKYDDLGSELIPCDASGNELAGWLFEDFWPDSDVDLAIQALATENEITFVREVYVKNRGTRTIPVMLNAGPSMLKGLSLQGITIDAPNPLAPDEFTKLTLTLRFHYTYNEMGYLNMVKQLLVVPRFNAPLSI